MANIIVSRLDADQVIKLSYDDAAKALKVLAQGGSLVPESYDHIILTYNANNDIQTVTYEKDGNQIALLTLVYDGLNRLTEVTRT